MNNSTNKETSSNSSINKSLKVELSNKGGNLYIFFGGIASGIAMPPFEFYRSSRIVDDNKIFFRDFDQCWYHNGLHNISSSIDSTAAYIIRLVEKIAAENVFFVGNSMGGYAAILFAKLVGKGEVIAFAPQTFISPWLRFKYKDQRWEEQIENTYKKSLFKCKRWNSRPLLLKSKVRQKISIFVSRDDRLDFVHAMHLKGIDDVNIYKFDSGGHGVVKLLRDEGKLPEIMTGKYSSKNI